MAKTAGTSLNGIFANRFERVCGHKGYSYDAYAANEKAKLKAHQDNTTSVSLYNNVRADRVDHNLIKEIGFEDCDYISEEESSNFYIDNFADQKFHNLTMELHVPCREPIDHLMSQCNFKQGFGRNSDIRCDSSRQQDDKLLYKDIKSCVFQQQRFTRNLVDYFGFNNVKCYDFKKQFTTYTDYMSTRLQPRKLVSQPYIPRETNKPRNKTRECLWSNEDLKEKAKAYLIQTWSYYEFCNTCIGSENDITR